MFDVMVDEELVQGEMEKKKNKKRDRRDRISCNSRGGRRTRDLIPPRECGGWTNGGLHQPYFLLYVPT